MLTMTEVPSEGGKNREHDSKAEEASRSQNAAGPLAANRGAVQFAFLLLNAWIGVQFILWARYFESGGSSIYIERPAGVDGWLPIAGLMNLRYFLATGTIAAIHPAAMVLLCVFLISSLLVKKSFCSWLCRSALFQSIYGRSAAG